MGSTSGTTVNLKEIFQLVLKTNAVAIILCHNHPSGNLKPSNADIALTKRIKSLADVVDIAVLDHIILTSEGYYSLSDEGHLIG
jgi:DNA repair protein RadC